MKGHQWNSQTSRILPHPQFWNSWIRHRCYIIDNSPSFSECYDWQQTTYLKIKLTYLRAFNARFCFIPCWRATSHAAHRQETLKQRILNPSTINSARMSFVTYFFLVLSSSFISFYLQCFTTHLSDTKFVKGYLKRNISFFFTAFECK